MKRTHDSYNENIKHSFYTVIPTFIILDHSLKPNEKILYGIISSLCNEKGYCFATNEYLSQVVGVSVRMVQLYIQNLKEHNYIDIILDGYANKPNKTQRKIYISSIARDHHIFEQLEMARKDELNPDEVK